MEKDGDLRKLLRQKYHSSLITEHIPVKPINYGEQDKWEEMKTVITKYFCKVGIAYKMPFHLVGRSEVHDYNIYQNNKGIVNLSRTSLWNHYARTWHWCKKNTIVSAPIFAGVVGALLIDDFAITTSSGFNWKYVVVPSTIVGALSLAVLAPTGWDVLKYSANTAMSWGCCNSLKRKTKTVISWICGRERILSENISNSSQDPELGNKPKSL